MKRKKLIEKAPLHVKKGDKVVVISGKDKGKTGKILTIDRDKRTVIVEGVNIITRHQRPTAKMAKGGIIKREGPVRAEKVMVADPRTGEPTRLRHATVGEGKDKKTVRVAAKSGEMIDQA